MDTKKEQFQTSGAGTGSAEQTGRDRTEQQLSDTDLSEQRRHDVASQIGESESRISSINELGGLSGRDDSSGGSGDRMEDQSTGAETDRS